MQGIVCGVSVGFEDGSLGGFLGRMHVECVLGGKWGDVGYGVSSWILATGILLSLICWMHQLKLPGRRETMVFSADCGSAHAKL